MRRGVLTAAAIAALGVVPARAADDAPMPIGQVARPGGGQFTLAAAYETERSPQGTTKVLCLETHEARADGTDTGGASSCPIAPPGARALVIASHTSGCGRGSSTLFYGTLEPAVAQVELQLAGGRKLTAQRFDAPPGLGVDVAFFAVAARGGPLAVKLSLRDAAGRALRIVRWPYGEDTGCLPSRFRGRQSLIARGTSGDTSYRLAAYRRDVLEVGRRLRDQLCLGLGVTGVGAPPSPFGGVPAESCGIQPQRRTKAFTWAGDTFGCGAKRVAFFYGLARPRVARIVGRSHRAPVVTVPVAPPRWLHTRARVFLLVMPVGAPLDSIAALDAAGRRLGAADLREFRSARAASSSCGSDYGGGSV